MYFSKCAIKEPVSCSVWRKQQQDLSQFLKINVYIYCVQHIVFTTHLFFFTILKFAMYIRNVK